MSKTEKKPGTKSERTLLTALLFSAPGPLVTGIAVLTSHSATQLADFLRRTAELVATFVSWLVYRRLGRTGNTDTAARDRLERTANRTVAIAMICSSAALFIVGISRLFAYTPSSNVIMGLVIAVLGLIANTIFWQRYRVLAREEKSAVIAAQQRLYRAKAGVDFCVVAALSAVAIAPTHPATQYIDAFGSIIVAAYLLYNGIDMLRHPAKAAHGDLPAK